MTQDKTKMDVTTKLKQHKIKRYITWESALLGWLDSPQSYWKNSMRIVINQSNCVTKFNPLFLEQITKLIILVGIENNFTTLVGKDLNS